VAAATDSLASAEGGEGLNWERLGNLAFGGDTLLSMLKGSVSGDDVASVLQGLSSFGFSLFIGLTLLFYILNDYANIFHWIGCHLGVPDDVGLGLVEDATRSMRGYFTGTTIVAVVTSVLIGVALWILDVPLVIPIVVVTFLLSYVPFVGAIVATAFAVIIALGSGGLVTALWVLVISLFIQNILQTVLNAKLLGDTLELHPVVVLVATIAGSVFAGLLGATLGAPFTAMFVRMSRRLRVEKTGLIPVVSDDCGAPSKPE
jgi:predicted PurR-regulated permease PerM